MRVNTVRVYGVVLALLAMGFMTGCPKYVGGPPPQSREQFVKAYKDGAGPFGGVEKYTIDRPMSSVITDMKQYANSCLQVRIEREMRGTGRHSTLYTPKVGAGRNGVMMLSVQQIHNDTLDKQEPPGGMYTLVAEFRSIGGSKTKIDVYHTGERNIAAGLKDWANGAKKFCPSL